MTLGRIKSIKSISDVISELMSLQILWMLSFLLVKFSRTYLNWCNEMGDSLEKMSSAGLSPSDILSAVLDEELERDLSTLAFLVIFLLLSAFKFALGGEVGNVVDEFSERCLLCGSQDALKFISVFSAWLWEGD